MKPSEEFNKISSEYDKGRISEDILFWAHEVEKYVELNSQSIVVDMGCGTGNYGLGIKEITGAIVVGFDPALGMLEQGHLKNHNFPLIRAIAENMPFRNDIFDLVYAAQVWHHIQGQQEAANECFRVLKIGGIKIVHTISHSQLNKKTVFKIFPGIKKNQIDVYPSDEEFISIFRKAGFQYIRAYPYSIERYQTADEFIEIAEKKLWSMFRPITQEDLENGIFWLNQWKHENSNAPIRNDELITLFIARK